MPRIAQYASFGQTNKKSHPDFSSGQLSCGQKYFFVIGSLMPSARDEHPHKDPQPLEGTGRTRKEANALPLIAVIRNKRTARAGMDACRTMESTDRAGAGELNP